MPKKIIVSLFVLWSCFSFAQVKLCSWNLSNFGKSKSKETIAFIANSVKEYDVIAIQEVVAGYGGAQAVARLADELNRKGSKWEYAVSDPNSTTSSRKERYAFIWKTASVRKKKIWLEKKYHLEIDREPYYGTFEYKGKTFTVVNFHAITKNRQPETEIKYFKKLPDLYPDSNLLFAGDFNCPQSHTVFNPLKTMGYQPVFKKQKTSLKLKCKQRECLASEFDNIFYHSKKIKPLSKKAHLFYENFTTMKAARKVSDHIPISLTFSVL